MAFYLEALSDLTAAQIDAGCREAIRTAEVFPKPGHIRKAVPYSHEDALSGPPQLTYPDVTAEDREEALKYSEALKSALSKTKPVKGSKLTIDEQKAILRAKGFLQ